MASSTNTGCIAFKNIEFFCCVFVFLNADKVLKRFNLREAIRLYLFACFQIAISEPTKISQKIAIFFSDAWNLMDAVSLPTFWVCIDTYMESFCIILL